MALMSSKTLLKCFLGKTFWLLLNFGLEETEPNGSFTLKVADRWSKRTTL